MSGVVSWGEVVEVVLVESCTSEKQVAIADLAAAVGECHPPCRRRRSISVARLEMGWGRREE